MPENDATYDVGGVMLPRPFQMGRFGHFGLYVREMQASVRFYTDLLGFHHSDDLPGHHEGMPNPIGTFLTYNSDHHAMVLIDSALGKARGVYDRGITVNQMSFQVGTLAEVMETNTMLHEEHIPVSRVGRDVPGSNWAVYFTDPDGHTVELFYGMEQIGWDRRSKPISAFGSFATSEVPDLPQPAEYDEIAGVEASTADIPPGHRWEETRSPGYDVGGVLLRRPFRVVNSGPISLFVEDIGQCTEFYRDELGMAVTEEVDYQGHRIVFLRSGTEHHTLALMPIALRSQLGLGAHTTLAGYGMQVGSYRQLCDAATFLKNEGCTLVDLPGELHTGIDYALHLTDPDGHLIQIYHEMEQVGTLGQPLTAAQRRPVTSPWPDHITPTGATSPNLTFQGPLG